MTFDDYASLLRIISSRQYPLKGSNMIYPSLKLAGEAGELADKIGKHWRNTTNALGEETAIRNMSSVSLNYDQVKEIKKEMGDVLWYLFALCEELGCTLDEVAQMNLDKLTDRKERGVICSEGDNR